MRAAAALVAVLALTACAPQATPDAARTPTSTPTSTATSTIDGEVSVYAAASLQRAFDEIASAFEQEYPGVDLAPIVYDGSSTLATQIVEGAPADVFASADERTMAAVVDAGLADASELFATNTLVIAVPAGNPAGVTSLTDLADPAVTVVLCAPEVPCGAASATLLAQQQVTATPASLEQNVSAVVTKVAAGEADAGLVYRTDVRGDDAVESIEPDGAADVVNRYPIAVLADAQSPDAAAAFVEFVLGDAGQRILDGLGFGAP